MISDKPSPPNNLSVRDVSESSVTLRWAPPDDTGGCDLTEYVVEKREGVKRRMWQQAGAVRASAPCELTLTKLIEGNQYAFRVIAHNPVGPSEPTELADAVIPKSLFCKSTYVSSYNDICIVVIQITVIESNKKRIVVCTVI